jgi:hypothetical protein
MKHEDFRLGGEFTTPAGRWRCTDVGTRTRLCENSNEPGLSELFVHFDALTPRNSRPAWVHET